MIDLLFSCTLGGIVGYWLGKHDYEIGQKLKKLEKTRKSGVTPGAYKKSDEFQANKLTQKSGVIKPKTPQRMEFENQVETEKESLGWRVTPK